MKTYNGDYDYLTDHIKVDRHSQRLNLFEPEYIKADKEAAAMTRRS
jgi:hypothetical protein